MKKSKLRDIPLILWDNLWNDFVKQVSGTDIDYFGYIELKKIDREKILILSIFSKDKSLIYRVFMSKEDYITQIFNSSNDFRWLTGSMENILDINFYSGRKDLVFLEPGFINIVYDFLGEDTTPVNSIIKYQRGVREERLKKKHQVEKDKIDGKMDRVKNIPKNFEKWVEDKALFKSRYIIYNYASRKMLDGYCTHCKSDVRVERPRHNDSGICPNCKSTIIYKASGKVKNLLDCQDVALIQKAGDELVVRYFYVTKDYSFSGMGYREPKLRLHEKARDFYSSTNSVNVRTREYEWANFKQTGEYRWCVNHDYNKVSYPVVYPSNLKRELKGTIYEYSALDLYAKTEVDFMFPVWRYLGLYPNFSALEYFVKIGLTNLVKEILYGQTYDIRNTLSLSADNIKDLLGIGKDKINTLINLNGGVKMIKILQNINNKGIYLTEEQIRIIDEEYDEDVVFEVMENTTFHKTHKYLTRQFENYNKYTRGLNSMLVVYKDYLRDCKFIGYNISKDYFLFPRNLEQAHQDTIALIEVKKDELIDKSIKNMFNILKDRFAWEYKDYVIIPPKDHEDLINEGSVLSHCVAGSYSKKMAEGETIILFIRKKENISEPFYTIEVSPKDLKIKQCRGYENSGPIGEVSNVVEKYKEKLLRLKAS